MRHSNKFKWTQQYAQDNSQMSPRTHHTDLMILYRQKSHHDPTNLSIILLILQVIDQAYLIFNNANRQEQCTVKAGRVRQCWPRKIEEYFISGKDAKFQKIKIIYMVRY